MSRRSQSRRRRAYGRRQHEVRERRVSHEPGDWANDAESREEWLTSDPPEEPRGYGPSFGSYLR